MTETHFNSQMLTRYLLGSLSSEEMERFDELSVTNSVFADALMSAESELVDAYVLGELSNEERLQFEKHYLSTARSREHVRFAEAFQLFGERPAQLPIVSKKGVSKSTEGTGWFSGLKSFFDSRPVLHWGFAVTVFVFLVASVWLIRQNNRLRQQILTSERQNNELAERQRELEKELSERPSEDQVAQEQETARSETPEVKPQSILSLVLTPTLRGRQERASVNMTPETTALAVRLELEPNDYSTYRVTLLNQNRQIWSSGNLKSLGQQNSKSVLVKIPASVLKPQAFILRVTGVDGRGSAEVIGDYPFQVK